MVAHIVEQGRHRERLTWRALLDRLPWFSLSGRPTWRRTVVFAESCRYTLPPADQADANKLGGLAFGLGGPHGTSARIGWSYDPISDVIELFAYGYANGARAWEDKEWPYLLAVPMGVPVTVDVTLSKSGPVIHANVNGDEDWCTVPLRASWWQRHFGLRLGLFFGGNNPAPHRIEVLIK